MSTGPQYQHSLTFSEDSDIPHRYLTGGYVPAHSVHTHGPGNVGDSITLSLVARVERGNHSGNVDRLGLRF